VRSERLVTESILHLEVSRSPRWQRIVVAALLCIFIASVVRLAWIGDDAYITLRTVENWVAGHGLRWNPIERVQTYTHPLWLLVLSAGRLLSGEAYFTTLVISMALSATAVILLLRMGGSARATIAGFVVLLGARSFLDYSSSGLENPLTFLLFALYVREVDGSTPVQSARFLRATLVAALIATNRLDLIVLCAPAWLGLARRVGFATTLRSGAIGWLPLLGWLAFATVYYGTPWPITAYAKAFAGGISATELLGQGLVYLGYASRYDPVLVAVIASGAVLGICVPRLGARGLALGVLCYTGYLVKIGGDFMGARLLTPPFVVAFAIWMRWLRAGAPRRAGWFAAAGAALAFLPGVPFWMLPPSEDRRDQVVDQIDRESGIVDERRFYYSEQGLFGSDRAAVEFDSFTRYWPATQPEHWVCLMGAASGLRRGPMRSWSTTYCVIPC
jgi:arabinofuranosyltransferase